MVTVYPPVDWQGTASEFVAELIRGQSGGTSVTNAAANAGAAASVVTDSAADVAIHGLLATTGSDMLTIQPPANWTGTASEYVVALARGQISATTSVDQIVTNSGNSLAGTDNAGGIISEVGGTTKSVSVVVGDQATESANELALNGEGLFTNVTRTPYTPANQLLGQAYDFSCAAVSCTMAANLADTPEAYVRQAILTDTSGTSLSNIPGGLQQLGFTGTAEYSTAVTTQSLADATSNGASVIVNVTTESGGVHAIVVDSITDGVANIRDPWPLGTGSSYGVPVQSLGSVLTGKGAIIHP